MIQINQLSCTATIDGTEFSFKDLGLVEQIGNEVLPMDSECALNIIKQNYPKMKVKLVQCFTALISLFQLIAT